MKESMIAEIPLFACLDKKAARFLSRVLEPFELPAREVLFREGESADHFYIVLAGELEAVKAMGTTSERLLNIIGAGDHIGEIAFLLPDGLRTASVRARTFSQLLIMSRDAFSKAVDRFPSIAWEISRRLASRLRNAENMRIQDLREKDQGIARTLRSLRSRIVHSLEKADSSSELAELLDLISEFERLSQHTLSRTGEEGLSQQDREQVKGFHRLSVPALQIETLGAFRVLRGGIPIEDKEWAGQRSKLLLKTILARHCVRVPKEYVFDDLWPDRDPVSCEQCLKVALHRLRKVLEPGLDKAYGSSYLHVSGNLLSLDMELCQVDAQEFESLRHRGEIRQKAGDAAGALSLFKRALDLYGGDFLPEDQYVPWVETRRYELQETLLQVLYNAAEASELLGASKSAMEYCERIIAIDPLAEKAYQRLMILYANKGMRSAALRTYEACRKILREELDSEPDDLTTSLHGRILQSH